MLRRGWSKLWPKGLTGQIILVALAGLVLIQLLSIQIYRTDREEALGYVNSRNAMQRIVSVVRLLALSPPSLYDEILKASRSETLLLRIADEPLQPDNRSPRFEQLVRSRLGYPSSLMVEISAELKQDAQRSRAWQHHNRMMKDRKGGRRRRTCGCTAPSSCRAAAGCSSARWWTRSRPAGPGRPPST